MSAVSRRLAKELASFLQQKEKEARQAALRSAATTAPEPVGDDTSYGDIHELGPVEEADLLLWKARISGPRGSPYEGGVFELRIEIPPNYPIRPPNMRFVTLCCHPNIHFKTGEICLDILEHAWSPAWTLASVCVAIGILLSHPEPNSPLNCDAANLLRCGDDLGYTSLVRMYTRLYAMQEVCNRT